MFSLSLFFADLTVRVSSSVLEINHLCLLTVAVVVHCFNDTTKTMLRCMFHKTTAELFLSTVNFKVRLKIRDVSSQCWKMDRSQ